MVVVQVVSLLCDAKGYIDDGKRIRRSNAVSGAATAGDGVSEQVAGRRLWWNTPLHHCIRLLYWVLLAL